MSIYRSFPLGETQTQSEIRLYESRGKLNLGDLTVDLRSCEEYEEFNCFSSKFLSFAVPKNVLPTTAPWTIGDIEYRILGYSDELFLGQATAMFVIGANINGTDFLFYYSKQRGLLGISGLNGGSVLLLSIEFCGFGAEGCAPTP